MHSTKMKLMRSGSNPKITESKVIHSGNNMQEFKQKKNLLKRHGMAHRCLVCQEKEDEGYTAHIKRQSQQNGTTNMDYTDKLYFEISVKHKDVDKARRILAGK